MIGNRAAGFLLLAFALSAAACNSNGAVNCNDVVSTPGGTLARACVHQVPNGATVEELDGGATIVTVNGQVIATYPPCPCARADAAQD